MKNYRQESLTHFLSQFKAITQRRMLNMKGNLQGWTNYYAMYITVAADMTPRKSGAHIYFN